MVFGHADSSNLIIWVTTRPTDNETLNAAREIFQLRHTTLGAMIWGSLMGSFQLEIICDEDKFKTDLECDGVKLWYYIWK